MALLAFCALAGCKYCKDTLTHVIRTSEARNGKTNVSKNKS